MSASTSASPDLSQAAENPELETEAVRRSQLNFFCAAKHPLAGRNSVTLEDLCEFPWVGPTVTDRMRRFLPEGDLPCGVFDTGEEPVPADNSDREFHRG